MIEPNDYEMCKHIATMVVGGMSEEAIRQFGYLDDEESKLCYQATKERPLYWASIELSAEAAGCCSFLPEGLIEALRQSGAVEKAYGGGNRSDAARYAAQVRWKGHQKKQESGSQRSKRLGARFDPANRKKGVKVSTPKEALKEIARGNLVEMESLEEAYTALDKLGKFLKKSKKNGEKVKINVCKISVPGTNLFCGESIATDEHPEGVPREKMPQLSGIPIKGSRADKMPRIDDEGNVDIGKLFLEHLSDFDPPVKFVEAEVPASSLRASQSELKGKTVAYMMSDEGAKTLDDPKAVIYVSRDGYIIDGHHRWAGKVGRDLADGKTGDVKIRVRRVDMPIMEVLDAALDFTEQEIQPKEA
jgi:hypothetical protein